ncbi:MAG: hypothetical protein ACFFDN_12735 [Candidatus Hodarchaeota archaeon]
MSKAIIWQYKNFIQSRKEKLVSMLLSEIIFLKTRFNRVKNKDELNHLKNALDRLEYLLNKLSEYSLDMPEEDFDKILMLIYRIFRDITDNLEQEIRV